MATPNSDQSDKSNDLISNKNPDKDNSDDQNIQKSTASKMTCAKDHRSHQNRHKRIEKEEPADFEEDEEESAHFKKIMETFLYYRRHSEGKLRSKIKSVFSIPEHHRQMIPRFRQHLHQIQQCVSVNYLFLKEVILSTGKIFENRNAYDQQGDFDDNFLPIASEFNMDKLHSTLRQIVRDWSSDGECEREKCYQPILDQLLKLWPSENDRSTIKILIPGAGLGRLAFEIAKLGFECQGNEFSLFMLFVSNFILNRCKSIDELTIYPYIHQWTNNWTYDDQIRSIKFPDINPSELPSHANFSMTAGDFLEIYGGNQNENNEQWDVVGTVFFIDTAHDVIAYMETIYRILKPNGYWLNFGPLLYHFADMDKEISLELPYEEILNIAKKLGFEILIDERKSPTTYTANRKSMLQYEYHCAYTVFKKLGKI